MKSSLNFSKKKKIEEDSNEKESFKIIENLRINYKLLELLCEGFNCIQEVFKSLVKSFYKGAAGIILVYSITEFFFIIIIFCFMN